MSEQIKEVDPEVRKRAETWQRREERRKRREQREQEKQALRAGPFNGIRGLR